MIFALGRVSGLSPFMGDTDLETMANVTIAEYDYWGQHFSKMSEIQKCPNLVRRGGKGRVQKLS